MKKQIDSAEEREILIKFYQEVCKEAEVTMMQPPYKLEGAHFNAMKRILKKKGIDTDVI